MRLAAHVFTREHLEQNTAPQVDAIKSFFVRCVGGASRQVLFVSDLSQVGFFYSKKRHKEARRASVGEEVQP